jgi:DNA-directed RNA polymerase subunit RPC12/RpoP
MKCGQCGGKLRRVHRTFWERFSYMAIYECRKCEREEFAPRRYRYHMGLNTRCPVCGSYRVVKLKHPDRIDRMHGGFLNFLERIAGKGKLFHCRWCRLQFYDRRELADIPKHGDPHKTTEPVHASASDPVVPPESADPAT